VRSVVISPHEININVGGGILGFIAPCNPHTQNQAHPPTHRTPSTRPTTSELRENKWNKKKQRTESGKTEKLNLKRGDVRYFSKTVGGWQAGKVDKDEKLL